jgi:RNA recognition motif-containing protein
MAVRLFIGNLSYTVTEAELRAHFATLGPLSTLALPMDRDTGKPRGFAFVEFRERAHAEEAIRRFNTQMFKGRALAVSEALARDGRATPSAPRPAAPRPPSSAATSIGDDQDFGPDAAPRRRRPRVKRGAQAEPRLKHPIYKRAAGPVRFSDNDDGDDEGRSAYRTPRRANLGEHDTS